MAAHSSEVLNTSITESWLRSHKLAPGITANAPLRWPVMRNWKTCGTIQTCVLNSIPVSLEFCDTHQHPATCPIASRTTTASWHKPLCFPIRTQPLEELRMLKGEWGCFHTIKINKKYILTKQASAQLAQIRYIAPPAYVIKSSQRAWDSQVRK